VRLSVEPDMTVHADSRLLRIAVENLLDNAWKYTGLRPDAEISVGAQKHGPEPVYFVKDNGVGFDMAYAGRLFGPFQRLHNESQFQGHGIGLVTVQRILARHGGRIWAEAEVNRGATFFFTLEGAAPAAHS
jgi:light-regulated signal transduction histidine kinase (bacteriophytochrome)